MFTPKPFFIACCLVLLISTAGAASGGAAPEGNETANTATQVGYTDAISNVVGPNDQFDYYVFSVPNGNELGGTIRLNSPEYGTVVRLSGPDGNIFTGNTTDNSLPVVFNIPKGPVPNGSYYVRVTFWSSGQYDHHYKLTFGIVNYSEVKKNWAPWPLDRGSVTNSGRALFEGPKTHLTKTRTIDLTTLDQKFQEFLAELKGDEFASLRVGPEGWIYFTFLFKKLPHYISLVGYNLNTGIEWREPSFDRGICLQRVQWTSPYDFRWYVCNCTSNLGIGRMNLDDTLYPGGCPLQGDNYTLNSDPRLLMAGMTICATADVEFEGMDDYHVFSMFKGISGDQIKGPRLSRHGVFYVCENNQGDVFARLDNEHVNKYNADSSEAGDEPETSSQLKELSIRPKYFMQPILGSDGCIWVSSIYTAQPEKDPPDCYGGRYTVIYDAGQAEAILKSGDYGPGKIVRKASYGSNSRLYIATNDDVITCYENWNQKLWETQLGEKPKAVVPKTKGMAKMKAVEGSDEESSGGEINKMELKPSAYQMEKAVVDKDDGYISEMIMDKDDKIYILRTNWRDTEDDKWCKLYILDPSTGEVLTEKELTPGGNLGPHNWIAIGPDKKLLWMNSAGWLKVYRENSIQMTAPFKERISQQKQ